MIVMEYNVKFMKLCWYALHIVSTEYRKARKFKAVLRFNIQNKVDVLRLATHQEVFQRAIIVERSLNESAQYREINKKRSGGTMSREQSLKRQSSGSSSRNLSNLQRSIGGQGSNKSNVSPTCPTC